jgi:hypothetical protein
MLAFVQTSCTKHCVYYRISCTKHCLYYIISCTKHCLYYRISCTKHCLYYRISCTKHCLYYRISSTKHCLYYRISCTKHCSYYRISCTKQQCWNILIQIYSSKQTEPKQTKPRFAVICPLGVSFHNYKCSPASSFIQNGRCYKKYKFLELINTALIQVKMSSNLICENYFHADLFFKKYIKIFCSES